MFIKPEKSKEIYDLVIAHRGYHELFPENTLSAFAEAMDRNYAIETDIRMTMDGHLICMHDRYPKRLLGIKGKISKLTFPQLNNYTVLGSDEKIPELCEVLKLLSGKTALLIEAKGFLSQLFLSELIQILKAYDGIVYFHAKNILTYYTLRQHFKERVFWVLNPFRKRFEFIRPKNYCA